MNKKELQARDLRPDVQPLLGYHLLEGLSSSGKGNVTHRSWQLRCRRHPQVTQLVQLLLVGHEESLPMPTDHRGRARHVPDQMAGQGSSRPLADRLIGLPTWVAARGARGRETPIRMRSLGANLGATRADDFGRPRMCSNDLTATLRRVAPSTDQDWCSRRSGYCWAWVPQTRK